uniref:Protein P7 n=1 Tax=Tobacco leaf enation phytoreovirus TaxID=288891 RepID=A2RQI4_9REOV|nr:unknown [Tobacco leaf enation phytoreovirus]
MTIAIVCLGLLHERVVLTRALNDATKDFYNAVSGVKDPRPDNVEATRSLGRASISLRKIVPTDTVILDFKDESFIMANKNLSLNDLCGSPSNTAPKSTFESVMPSLSTLFGTPFVQGAYRQNVIASNGNITNLLILVVGPPSGFSKKIAVASASSTVETSTDSKIDLSKVVDLNTAMISETSLPSASAVKAMSVGDVMVRCDSLDRVLITKAIKYFTNYVYNIQNSAFDESTKILLNSTFEELLSVENEKPRFKSDVMATASPQLRGIVLPVGHGKSYLCEHHPEIFVEIDSVFSKEEHAKLDELRKQAVENDSWEEYNSMFNSYVKKAAKRGEYDGKIILGHHSDNLLPNGIRLLGIYSLDTEESVDQHIKDNPSVKGREDLLRSNWKSISREATVKAKTVRDLHNKILNDMAKFTSTALKSSDKCNESSGLIKIRFINGFPKSGYSVSNLEKAGIQVVASDDDDIEVYIYNTPINVSRRRRGKGGAVDDAGKPRQRADAKSMNVDTDKVSEDEFIGKVKSL